MPEPVTLTRTILIVSLRGISIDELRREAFTGTVRVSDAVGPIEKPVIEGSARKSRAITARTMPDMISLRCTMPRPL